MYKSDIVQTDTCSRAIERRIKYYSNYNDQRCWAQFVVISVNSVYTSARQSDVPHR